MLDAWLDLALGAACAGCQEPGRLLCRRCAENLPAGGHEVRPEPCPEGLAPAFASDEYAGQLRALVITHKEHRGFALARPLGRVLSAVVAASGATRCARVLLVPVPSRPAVVRERGHDPVLRMTRFAAGRLRAQGCEVRVDRLLRQRAVVSDQAGLDAAGRSANLRESMTVQPGRLAALARTGVPVAAVVCDDVITTGATAREAQRALESVGVPVAAVACLAATRRRLPPSSSEIG